MKRSNLIITPAFFEARQRKLNFEITNNRVFPREESVSGRKTVNIVDKYGSQEGDINQEGGTRVPSVATTDVRKNQKLYIFSDSIMEYLKCVLLTVYISRARD